jgi:tRNA (guanosine-2'-O-)-methyltransferase
MSTSHFDPAAADAAMRALLGKSRRRSPYSHEGVEVGGRLIPVETVVQTLGPYLTEERRARIEAALDGRSHHLATVVEGLINTGNVSAVMRTAEGLGVQPLHAVQGPSEARFKRSSRTAQGGDKWLDVHVWEGAADCAAFLRARGYQIAVTHLDDDAVPISHVDFTRPTALVFGNERDGASEAMLAEADVRVILPLTGFVQSYNISVAAAIGLYHAWNQRTERLGAHGDLSRADRDALRASFYARAAPHAERILLREVEAGDEA